MGQELHQQHLDSYSFPENGVNIFFSSGASTFKCNQCQFVGKSGLKIHATKIHATTTSDSLINLMKVSKPYACDKCDSTLSSQESLHKHIKTFHTISPPKEFMYHVEGMNLLW
jgi:hypothetical protein